MANKRNSKAKRNMVNNTKNSAGDKVVTLAEKVSEIPAKEIDAPAVKEDTVKKEEVKVEVREEVKAAPVEAAEKKETAPAEAPKKRAGRPKGSKNKKTLEKKGPGRPKGSTKETTDVKPEVFVEYQGNQFSEKSIMNKVVAAWEAEGKSASALKRVKLYVKPEDGKAYYVANEKLKNASTGAVEL